MIHFKLKLKNFSKVWCKVWCGKSSLKKSEGYDDMYDRFLINFNEVGEACRFLKEEYLMEFYGLATTKTLKNAIYNKNKETGIIGTLVTVKSWIDDKKEKYFNSCLKLAKKYFSKKEKGGKEFASSWEKIKTIAHPENKTGYGKEKYLMGSLEWSDKQINEMLEKLAKGDVDLDDYKKWAMRDGDMIVNYYNIISIVNAFAAEKLSEYSSQENEQGMPLKIVSTILSPITTIAKKLKKSSK